MHNQTARVTDATASAPSAFSTAPKKSKKVFAILLAITAALLAYGTTSGLALAARLTIGIFILAAVLWMSEAIPLYLTSFVILFLEVILLGLPSGALGLAPGEYKIFLQPFFDPVILLFLSGFTLGAALNRHHLDAIIAANILRRLPTTPGAILAGFIAITAALSMWMSNTATTALMLAVMTPLLKKVPAGDPWRSALVLAIPFAANIGGMGTPVGTPPNAIALGALNRIGIHISFLQWIALALPIMLCLLFALWFVLMRSFHLHQRTDITLDIEQPGSISGMGWLVLITFMLTALLWLTAEWHGIPEGIIGIVPVIVFFGSGALLKADINHLGWDVLLILGGGMSLSVAFQKAGLPAVITSLVQLNVMNPWQVILLITVLASLLATFISHTAAASLFVPIVIGLGGSNIASTAIVAALATSIGMVLPISTPPNTMAYGTGEVDTRQMASQGIRLHLLGIIALTLAAITYWCIII